MKFQSSGTSEFWRLYQSLPPQRKELAKKCYRLWAQNALHPSLHFKPLSGRNWSVRVGAHMRAVGVFQGDHFAWEWIGTHESYNKKF